MCCIILFALLAWSWYDICSLTDDDMSNTLPIDLTSTASYANLRECFASHDSRIKLEVTQPAKVDTNTKLWVSESSILKWDEPLMSDETIREWFRSPIIQREWAVRQQGPHRLAPHVAQEFYRRWSDPIQYEGKEEKQ